MADMDLQTHLIDAEKRWSETNLRMQQLEDNNQMMFQRLNKQAAMVEDI